MTTTKVRKPGGIKSRPKIIYFRIGWMVHYAGLSPKDLSVDGSSYLGDNDHGAESFNFVPDKAGRMLGYRPPGNAKRTNISRLGAKASADHIDHVLVVWVAPEPTSSRMLIVGWYENARVHRTAKKSSRKLNGEFEYFSAETDTSSARLLRPGERTFEVQSGIKVPGEGFGRSPTWYGTDAVDARVWRYVKSFGTRPARTAKKPPRNQDPELRRTVEEKAVEHAQAYYEARFGAKCWKSVERDRVGWDLQIHRPEGMLRVEVKGLMGSDLICELTPNEYDKMMQPEYSASYVIYIVNNALAEPPAVPVASIFEHAGKGRWRAADGRELIITPKTGAVLSCR